MLNFSIIRMAVFQASFKEGISNFPPQEMLETKRVMSKKGSPAYEFSVFFHPLVIFFHALFETFQKNSTTHNCPANCISIFRKAQLLLTLRDPTNYLILNQLRTLVSHELRVWKSNFLFFIGFRTIILVGLDHHPKGATISWMMEANQGIVIYLYNNSYLNISCTEKNLSYIFQTFIVHVSKYH